MITYGAKSRELQVRYDTIPKATKVSEKIAKATIGPVEQEIIESVDMFFLATSDEFGRPTCSYKGGDPGFVQVLDERTFAFPDLEGNGMFLSLGNVLANPQVGVLFLDLVRGGRLRVHGTASLHEEHRLLEQYEGAHRIVEVRVRELFPNCHRHVHRYQLVQRADTTPKVGRAKAAE
jgi:predicted pyridoxine 5'-phosphate oxidase superfamily flavin-nucleotide-binding protein